MKKNIFAIVIFLILIVLAIYAPITSYLEKKGIVEGKSVGIELSSPESETGFGANLINIVNNIKYNIDTTYQNYMPLYVETVGLYKDAVRNLNKSLYTLYDDINKSIAEKSVEVIQTAPPEVIIFPDETLDIPESTQPSEPEPFVEMGTDKILSYNAEYIGASLRDRYYKVTLELTDGTKVEFIEAISNLTEEQKDLRVNWQIASVNRLIQANSDVNVCVYAPLNMEYTSFLKKYIPDEKSSQKYLDQFIAGIDKSAKVGYINFSGVLDRVDRCYLTDHHWSAVGSYEGYCDIINLFRIEAPEIIPPRPMGTAIKIEPCKFYGSYVRNLVYSQLWDDFVVIDYSLPTHTSNPEFNFYSQIEKLKAKNNTSINSNVYGEFFAELNSVSYPENNTGRNLLIIGDSYTQGFIELISSSFDNTFCFYWSNYQTLNYNQFIEENGITDVLIMQYGPRLIFNATDDYYLDKINTTPYVKGTEETN